MFDTLNVPKGTRLRKAALATTGAVCVLFGGMVASHAADWGGPMTPLPGNEFGTPGNADYRRVDILTNNDVSNPALNDGTLIFANPAPSVPSTGTGVFQPFYTVHRSSGACNSSGSHDCQNYTGYQIDGSTPGGVSVVDVGSENGFNTDDDAGAPPTNFDMLRGNAGWTRAVTMSEFNITDQTTGYIELSLDANQEGAPGSDANKLLITEMQIFIAPDLAQPEASGAGVEGTGYEGGIFDLSNSDGASPNTLRNSSNTASETPVWSLDSAINGNVDILLQASICGSNGQCGSGMGDMTVRIPVALLTNFGANPFAGSDNFVLYTETLYVNDGYEEWKFKDEQGINVAEPGTLAVFGVGVIGLGAVRRRRQSKAQTTQAE